MDWLRMIVQERRKEKRRNIDEELCEWSKHNNRENYFDKKRYQFGGVFSFRFHFHRGLHIKMETNIMQHT